MNFLWEKPCNGYVSNLFYHIDKTKQITNNEEEFKEKYFSGEEDIILKIEKAIGPSSYEGTVNITLLDGETRDTVSSRKVSNAIRERVGSIYDAEQLSFGFSFIVGMLVVSIIITWCSQQDLRELSWCLVYSVVQGGDPLVVLCGAGWWSPGGVVYSW